MPEATTVAQPGLVRTALATLGRLFGRTAAPVASVEQRAAAPRGRQRRMYAAARQNRLTAGFGSSGNSSADAELHSSLTMLRSRSRQMVRDSAYAKRARLVVVNNVIGAGVNLQAQVMNSRGELSQRVNADIEAAFADWMAADSCHTGGALHFNDLERAAMAQVFDAGEAFIRMHFRPFGRSRVPLALELVEAERLAHDGVEHGPQDARGEVRMGVEVDEFGRALAYWIRRRHPGDVRFAGGGAIDSYERVPADEVFHLRIVDRWPQTRGEPWLHTVLRKLDDMNEYSGSELQAARAAAYTFATIETPDNDDTNPLTTEETEDESLIDIEPLTVQKLNAGEKLNFYSPERPNTAIDPFLRYMLREVAAGVGPSYESLSRDYSQGNYSSSRLGVLDDRDLWRVLQRWWIRSFREQLHCRWLQQAVLAKAVATVAPSQYAADVRKFEACAFKPRGWTWVDPTKEVAAYKEAIKGGLTTLSDVIAATAGGQDLEDFLTTRKRELELLAAAGIRVDTTVEQASATAKKPLKEPPGDEDPEADDAEGTNPRQPNDPPSRVVSFPR